MRFFFLLTMLFSFSFSQNDKMVLTILDFKGDVVPGIKRSAYKTLEVELFATNRYDISAVENRDDIMQETKYQYSGACADECLVQIGEQLGADYLVNGEILDLGDGYQIFITIIDIEEGKFYESVKAQTERTSRGIVNGIEELAREITRKISLKSAPKPMMQQLGQITTSVKTYGSIDIISEPAGADILIDLVEYGVTPKTIEQIETGPHDLILNYPGYERLQKRIMVMENQTISVSEYLVPKTGSLSILTEPSGANVYLDNITKGQTPLNLMNLPVRDYIIRVELQDYQIIERRISVQYNENTTQKYDLEPLPGKLSLFTTPGLVTININGKRYTSGSNGIASIELPVGKYILEVSKDGYEPMQRQVSIKPNDLGSLDINLKRLPAGVSSNPDMGFLTANTLDDRTRIKITGEKDIQRLPLQYYELKYGTYMIKAFGKGLETEKRKINIDRQKTTTVDINLKRKQKSKAVRYSMLFPGGGQIYEGSVAKYRGLLYTTAFVGAGALLAKNISSYSDEKELLDLYQANYLAATSSSDIDAKWALYSKQSSTVNDVRTNLMIFTTALISSYISGIIDSYFFSGLR